MKIKILGLFIAFPAILLAQTDFEKEKEKMRKEFEKAQKQQKETFFKFREEVDKKFVEALRQNWKAVNGSEPEKTTEEPKPNTPPVAPAPDNTSSPIDVKVGTAKPKPPVVHEIPPQIVKPEETARKFNVTTFEYLSNHFEISTDLEITGLKVREVSENGAALFWAQASNMDYKTTLNELIAKSKQLNFNDWGYSRLIHQTANILFSGNEAVLFEWFLLCKSGFAARVGTDGNKFYLLMPIENKVFGSYYFQINGKNYYLMSSQAVALRVHDKDFPNATNSLSLDIASPLSINGMVLSRTLKSSQGISITVPYLAPNIEFYKQYPWAEFRVYFNGKASSSTTEALVEGLRPFIANKKKYEALDVLLNFVQTAFEYATDEQQFGYEKPLFVEETIHYRYSDCEDRSFFFAFLVRELMGLEVIGLLYPGHLATAVHLEEEEGIGNYVTHEGKMFFICDPTYIGAKIGMAMPKFHKVKAEVIVLK